MMKRTGSSTEGFILFNTCVTFEYLLKKHIDKWGLCERNAVIAHVTEPYSLYAGRLFQSC